MRLPKYQDRGSLEFNMTPMIDVTFLLIIFFLVSSHLAKQEVQVELNLPTAAAGDETAESEGRRITVNLTADGTLLLAGESIDAAELGRRLGVARRNEPQIEVRIRSDREVDYGRVKPLLRQCLLNDVWRVTFAVVKPS
ncbi:MAG: biopolymer transporter ExbD [Pirellulales bacterium]